MAAPSVTYTFTNGTTADATQVNTNFTDLINGASDGTKDYTLNSLTANGNLTVSGNMIFGSASGDTITFNGSVASTIPVSANATYDFGGSTSAMASFYIGNGTKTVRLVAAAMAASYTLTMPTSGGTSGQFALTDGSGVLSFRYPEKTVAKTTTYTATGDESTILVSASSGWTLTLPAAASFSGKHFYIKKTDSNTNNVTIDANGSETIDGALTKLLCTQYESFKIVSDGTNWHTVEHFIPGTWVQWTPTFTGFGTPSGVEFYSRRVGDSLQVRGRFTSGISTAVAAAISLGYNGTDANITIAGSSKINSTAFVGTGVSSTVAAWTLTVLAVASGTTVAIGSQDAGDAGLVGRNGNVLLSTGNSAGFFFQIPVVNWEG